MKITDLMSKEAIKIHGHASNKMDAIDQMVSLMYRQGNVSDKEAYKEAVIERENLSTTGMVDGIAIPHARTTAITKAGIAAMTLPEGVDYHSMDGQPTTLIFLIAAPDNGDNVHLQVLSELSTLLMDHDFCEDLKNAGTPEEFLSIIDLAQSAKHETEAVEHPEVLAVTACPTGIAHTYMAAEALEKKAKEMGVSIKVETQGSVGVKNELSQEDIEHAKGVIIAADKNISLNRFNGLPLYSCPVARGIDEPETLIQIILDEQAPVYKGEEVKVENNQEKGWHIPYKHLMNGFSHALPILVVAGFMSVLAFSFTRDTQSQYFQILNVLGNILYLFVLPVLSGYIAMSIADRPTLGPGLLCGYIAYSGFSLSWLNDPVTLRTSGFLGAIVGGFLAGYLMLVVERLFKNVPDMFDGIKPVLLYPVLGVLASGIAMTVLNTYLIKCHTIIIDCLYDLPLISVVIIGASLGAMMSIDMGGPINKFAYLFANALVFTKAPNSDVIMAAVMGAGMIPPLAIAFSTLVFKEKWTEEERGTTFKNIIMGLSFVSEGAIPFIKKDQKHVLPACILGSFITGALSAYYKCGVMLPHGGIWVIYLMTNPFKYVIALLAGTIVSGLIITFTHKSEY
ncbi:fructose-specific PTS transporter subunit EIIC [uncultured Catenibacterium sp.]|uniref:PTS fructose transporter subunit IIABC n=1 Tax=uncultured Catenibacterium sp. TaxID=286142 RepID=UPI0025FD8AC1|nr:fructose-specific PTS transporter subunit EIIC [uncultured Catenibacterium sp.]